MCASSPFTFFCVLIPARSSVSHVTSFTWWLALSFPQRLLAACRSLLLQCNSTISHLQKTHNVWIVRWRRVRVRARVVFLRADRARLPLRLRCLLLWTGERLPSASTLLTFGRWRHSIPSFTIWAARCCLALVPAGNACVLPRFYAAALGESH